MWVKTIFAYLCIFETILLNTSIFCYATNANKSIGDENREDIAETNEDSKEASLEIPTENFLNNLTACTRRENTLMHEIRTANPSEFPFMVAIMSPQNQFLCSGVVVSNGMILTSARCSQQAIDHVLLNTTNDKNKDSCIALRVKKIEKFPTYDGGEIHKDVALIYTEKYNNTVVSKIKLGNYTDKKSITDFEAFGYGLNVEVGEIKELQYVGLENRESDVGDYITGYLDCIDTKVPTCFKDIGGPAVFGNELIGIVVNGQNVCLKEMTAQFAINNKVVDILPIQTFKVWLEDQIKKNEESTQMTLVTYPAKPIVPDMSLHKMTTSGTKFGVQYYQCLLLCLFLLH
ncbi:uncharacterized protein LOC114242898 [Bombyx mandarina]|uniref:Uncharacterized protein LOC114242898 n=1 Tax=Bombyx mandarina TaxID=7092 RepID=A0A6J2JL31_BOMMA|nr:uncharacterized protein LOC114242898 [Bombyx mandarina]